MRITTQHWRGNCYYQSNDFQVADCFVHGAPLAPLTDICA
jgi:hypothetical protein